MHPAHPVGVAAGEVVVDGDDVHAVAGERVQVRRQGGDQRLALTGLHLGDVAEVQRGAAHQLHLVVELAEGAPGRLAHDRERLRQQVVERLAVGVALLERVGQRAQLGVAEIDVVIFERLDVIGDRRQSPDLSCPRRRAESWLSTTAAMVRARRHSVWLALANAWEGDGVGAYAGVQLDDLVITSARLTLRPWRASDADAVMDAMQDRSMFEFLPLPDPYTRTDADAFVTRYGDEGRADGTGIGSAVVETSTGRLVGSAALRFPAVRGSTAATIGYWVAAAGRGNGYAAEASRAPDRLGVRARDRPCRDPVRDRQRGVRRSRRSPPDSASRACCAAKERCRGPRHRSTTRSFGRLPARPRRPGGTVCGAPSARQRLGDGVVELRPLAPADGPRSPSRKPTGRHCAGRSATGPPTTARIRGARECRGRPGLAGRAGAALRDRRRRHRALRRNARACAEPARRRSGLVGYGVHPGVPRPRLHRAGAAAAQAWAFDAADFARLELGAKRGERRLTEGGARRRLRTRRGAPPADCATPDGTFSDEVRFAVVNPRYQ